MSLNELTNTSFKNTAIAESAENRQEADSFHKQMIAEGKRFEFMERKAQVMSQSVATIPKHLQGNPGDCMAIIMMAEQWGMNAFSVAQKTHLINGVMGYEAQLVNAVVSSSNKIVGSFNYEWFGPWEKIIGKVKSKAVGNGKPYLVPDWKFEDEEGLGIRVSATLRGEDEPRVLELLLLQAQVRNSTLWASDPKQQLAYLGVKRWARLYAPDVILGVYSPEELKVEKDITPKQNTTVFEHVNTGDEKAFSEFSEALNGATTLAKLTEIKEKMVKASDSLNDQQKNALSGIYKDQAKFIKEAQQAEEQAAQGE